MAFLFQGNRDSISSQSVLRLRQVNPRSSNIGDISGDGFEDYCFTGISGSVTDLKVFFGGPSIDSLHDLQFGENTGTPGATFQALGEAYRGDFDADGVDELISWSADHDYGLLFSLSSPLDSIHDLIFRPVGFSFPSYSFGWGMATGDFNGDSYLDIALNLMPAEVYLLKGEVWVYFGGPSFDTIPEMRFTAPGSFTPAYGMERFGTVLVNLGDVNADGYDDLFSGYFNSNNLPSHIYFGGPSFDSLPDVTIAETAETASSAGDVNRDGYNDLLIGYSLQSSSASYALVYYGGPTIDSLADIMIFAGQLPEYNLRFGSAVAGVGDVNGDGVDDFAVGAVNAFDRGEVFVFSGTGIPVDVPDDPNNLPNRFTLHPNYPNPFNPSTTISFDLPRRARVTLSIVNILGQEIARLVDQEISAGTHSVEWDGRDESGEAVASGVYLYRLETEDGVLSRKMLLLK